MDWIERKNSAVAYIKKYRMIALIILIGIFLMTCPVNETNPAQDVKQEQTPPKDLEDSLELILSQLYGAGNVEVLLTQAQGEEIRYQMDEDISQDDKHRDTVLVSNSQREETGLIRQVISPVYQGAIILCQGADNATVRLSIVEAVMSVTGLTSDHITVLKMK